MRQLSVNRLRLIGLACFCLVLSFHPVPGWGQETYSITLSVRDDGGNPIDGVTVNLNGLPASAIQDVNGDYLVEGLSLGNYVVSPEKEGWEFIQQELPVSLPTTGEAYSPDAWLTFTGSGSLSIRGSVYSLVPDGTKKGIRNVSVTCSGSDTPVFTDVDGFYQFLDLAPGTYTVEPSFAGFGFTPGQREVVLPTAGEPDSPDGTADFQAAGAYRITGRVTNVAGVGLPGVNIVCSGSDATGGADGPAATVRTDRNGRYVITDLPPGIYTVVPVNARFRFTKASVSVRLPTANQSYSPDGKANFRGSSAGNAKALLPLAYYLVRDSDGWAPAAGADVILMFEPNGITQLYLATETDAIAIKGSYAYSAGMLNLKFTDPAFRRSSVFPFSTTKATVTIPFKVFNPGAGSSTWTRHRPSVVHNLVTLFKSATVNEGLFFDQAIARVLAYANAIIQVDQLRAPAPLAAAATPMPRLKVVGKLANGVKLTFDNGPVRHVILYGWANAEGQPITLSPLFGDPRTRLPVTPATDLFDPDNKTALLVAPFNSRNTIAWYDSTYLHRQSNFRTQKLYHFAMGGDDDIPGMTQLLRDRGYDVVPLTDALASVESIIDESRQSPGFIYYTTHGSDHGALATGDYLGNSESDSDQQIFAEFDRRLAEITADATRASVVNYQPISPTQPSTLVIVDLERNLRGTGTSSFIGITPKFWEALREAGGMDLSRSLVYVSACYTDKKKDLREAVRSRAYMAFSANVTSEFSGAVFKYLCQHLSHRTRSAEEAYYNILRVATTRLMIYDEDNLLNGNLQKVEEATDPETGAPLHLRIKDMFRAYGYGQLTNSKVLFYQDAGWLTRNKKGFNAGDVWWLLFGGRWGQDAQDSSDAIKNVCWNDYWSKGNTGGLASPGCNAWSPGHVPTTLAMGYSTYLLAGSPIFKTVRLIPRWTLNDALAP